MPITKHRIYVSRLEVIEVLNNGSSSLYGNASGGVINILTTGENTFKDKAQFLNIGLGMHSFSGQQYQLTAGKKFNSTSIILHANHHLGNGYREHSQFQSTNFNARVIKSFNNKSKLEAIVNYMNSPTANDPGGVNLTLFDSIPKAARDRNVQFKAGEAIDQLKAALSFNTSLNEKMQLKAYGFYSYRNFYGLLPFSFGGVIDLKRNYMGHGTSASSTIKSNNLNWNSNLGYELLAQNDDRQRFENNDGEQGNTTLHQDEKFSNIGLYWVNNFNINNWMVNAAIRYDFNQIKAVDKFLDNGDDSGEIPLNDFNYSIGLAYQLSSSKTIFFNHSTSFETPTLNELSKNPGGSGFNTNLKPQYANHFELGLKGYLNEKGAFQASAFYVDSKNEILSYEDDEERTFYENAGRTARLGLEAFVNYPLTDFLTASTNWSWHKFTFTDFAIGDINLKDNILPGLPNFQGNVMLDFTLSKKLFINIQNQVIGKIFTNNENTTFQSPKSILNLSIKYAFEHEKFQLHPYIGINNMFGVSYADNIRINAFGNRFYEAASKQFIYGGLRIKL